MFPQQWVFGAWSLGLWPVWSWRWMWTFWNYPEGGCMMFLLSVSIYIQDCKMSHSQKLNALNGVEGHTLFSVMCSRGRWWWTTTVCSSSGCADVPSATQVSSGMSHSLSAPSDSRRYGSEAEYLVTWFSK